jgi:hypothetical protein
VSLIFPPQEATVGCTPEYKPSFLGQGDIKGIIYCYGVLKSKLNCHIYNSGNGVTISIFISNKEVKASQTSWTSKWGLCFKALASSYNNRSGSITCSSPYLIRSRNSKAFSVYSSSENHFITTDASKIIIESHAIFSVPRHHPRPSISPVIYPG